MIARAGLVAADQDRVALRTLRGSMRWLCSIATPAVLMNLSPAIHHLVSLW
jgi:hypothetical protein